MLLEDSEIRGDGGIFYISRVFLQGKPNLNLTENKYKNKKKKNNSSTYLKKNKGMGGELSVPRAKHGIAPAFVMNLFISIVLIILDRQFLDQVAYMK